MRFLPHTFPMFKDLKKGSKCDSNQREVRLAAYHAKLVTRAAAEGLEIQQPTGFVFHESRVGSTLVANAFGSDPFSMVFSESGPPATALLHPSGGVSRRDQVAMVRQVMELMCDSAFHKHCFFKFQSITSTKMDILMDAFPEVPWVFLYRSPVQTMMSHLDPSKLKNPKRAPCLRSKRRPPEMVQTALSQAFPGKSLSNLDAEAHCAAHLNMLCLSAIKNYEANGVYAGGSPRAGQQRGVLVNYEALPGAVPRAILPLFGITQPSVPWLTKMASEVKIYSKGRVFFSTAFQGDSADKEKRSTPEIKAAADTILANSYADLEKYSKVSLANVLSDDDRLAVFGADGSDANWKRISKISV